jgi:S-formylglutathione hydrolase FrmB
VRNDSPLDDLTFIRNMTGSEQTAFAHEIPIPGLTAFLAASTDAALQEREQAEVRKHANNGRMPPWYAPSVHTETPNLAVRTPTTNRDYPDHFQTSLVTASNLPGVGTETEMPNQLRRDGFVVRTPTTNRVTPLQPGRGRRSPQADCTGYWQNPA